MRSFILVLLTIFTSQAHASEKQSKDYGVNIGNKAPDIAVKDIDGKAFDLKSSLKDGPVVLVFYRGGWCPYCNLQLRNLQQKLGEDLAKLNSKIVAISVDLPDAGLKTKNNENLKAVVISDPDAKILADYKLQFKVPEELVAKYKNDYKIDVEGASGRKHHIIAVPAVYVVDKSGTITYRFVDVDYKKRAPEADILKAVKASM